MVYIPTTPALVAYIPTTPALVVYIPTTPALVVYIPTTPALVAYIPTTPALVAYIPTTPALVVYIPTTPALVAYTLFFPIAPHVNVLSPGHVVVQGSVTSDIAKFRPERPNVDPQAQSVPSCKATHKAYSV